MRILVLNAGSWSLKFQLIETGAGRVMAKGIIEGVGREESTAAYDNWRGIRKRFSIAVADYTQATGTVLACLTDPTDGVLESAAGIEGVGHRIVHGGEHLAESTLLDDSALRLIAACSPLAPLHNPLGLEGIQAARCLLPGVPQVAVFDTSFHQSMPSRAYLYGLPYSYYTSHRIRRYGFHGTSHRYVSERFAEIHNAEPESFKLISCHLGNGCSLCAIDRGRSLDTSMGFTPLEGLVMGTRCGDLDPAVVFHLLEREGLRVEEVDSLLNRHSGLLGLSGVTNDVRELLHLRSQGHPRARLALEVFCYRVKKYIGAFFAVLDGAHAIIFTGGIGENAFALRAEICDSLSSFGVELDPARNEAAAGVEAEISSPGARTPVWVIPTDESLLIARDAERTIRQARGA